MFEADLAALLARKLGRGWGRAPEVVGLDRHLRRDLGLPPLQRPVIPILRHHGF